MQIEKLSKAVFVVLGCHFAVVNADNITAQANTTSPSAMIGLRGRISRMTEEALGISSENQDSEPMDFMTTLRNVTVEVLHPDLIPCKTDDDCKSFKPKRKTQKIQNMLTKNDYSNMICYNQRFCMVNGSDFAVDPMSSVVTARRALYTFQLTHAFQKEALNTMALRKYAYCNIPQLSYFYSDPRGPSFAVYRDSQDPATGILVFKPTTRKYEWAIVNANGKRVPCELATTGSNPGAACGIVHDGFQTAFLEKLASRVLDAVEPYSKLIIVGYSLGGALAQCAAVHIPAKNKNLKIIGFYTFASPRLGDVDFVQAFNKNVLEADVRRVVSMSGDLAGPRDIVTLLPPTSQFQHVRSTGIGVMCQNATTGAPCRGTDFEIHFYDGYRDAIQRDYDSLGGKSQCLKW